MKTKKKLKVVDQVKQKEPSKSKKLKIKPSSKYLDLEKLESRFKTSA